MPSNLNLNSSVAIKNIWDLPLKVMLLLEKVAIGNDLEHYLLLQSYPRRSKSCLLSLATALLFYDRVTILISHLPF